MSEKVALTGATGFVGSALARRLSAIGYKIKALLRPASAHKRPAEVSATWIEGDLDNLESLQRLVEGADAVIHCAGAVRGASQEQFNRVNADGMARLATAAASQKSQPRFLLISSLAAREPQLSHYAGSKREGEKLLAEIYGQLAWTVYRPCAVYGPGDREMLPLFRWMAKGFAPLIGSGSGRFSMIYVEDLAAAILQWLNCNSCRCGTYELHDGHPGGYSWQDVIETVRQMRTRPVVGIKIPLAALRLLAWCNLMAARSIGYAPMLTPGKVRELNHLDWAVDNTALSQATGWTPRVLLPEGLRLTLDWYKACKKAGAASKSSRFMV